jgi:hypothetical protein
MPKSRFWRSWALRTEFLTAVAVAVMAALLERLALQLARCLWNSLRPAAA